MKSNQKLEKYQGWKNYYTWNVALFINNDEFLYTEAKQFKNYNQFVKHLKNLEITHTMDGVNYSNKHISRKEMNDMLKEL